MLYPEIKRTPHWSPESVRAACIKNDLYTCGDSDEYNEMLRQVSLTDTPSDFGIYRIAADIVDHSDMQTVTNVMYILANEAVTYTFEIDGDDTI